MSSCLKSRKEEERVHEEDKRTKSNESSQTRRYRNQPEEATPKRSKQHSKQPPHNHGMMHIQVWCMSGLNMHGMAKCTNKYYKLNGAQYATSCILTKHHDKLFSLIPFMYPTILNVVKHGKRVKQKKTTYLGKFKWGRNNEQQFWKLLICIY